MTDFFDPKSLSSEDSLESLLDEESDEEFGLPRFQEHFADPMTPAVLKDMVGERLRVNLCSLPTAS